MTVRELLAVRVESGGRTIGYTGDAAWTDDLPRFFGGVDMLVAEFSYIEMPRGMRHLDPTEAAHEERLAERLSAGYGGEITVARDGLTIE